MPLRSVNPVTPVCRSGAGVNPSGMMVTSSGRDRSQVGNPTDTEFGTHRRVRSLRIRTTAVPLLFIAFATACAPPFSELQSARLAGMERFEITGSYGSVTASFPDEDSERVQNQYGVQFATGLSNAVDVRLRYERVTAADGDGALNVLGGGPKVGLVPDRLAFYLPIGFAFGEDIETWDTWQAHPTLIATVAVMDKLDVNGSAKVLFPFEGDLDTTMAFNVGLGIGEFDGFVVRPEFGILINPGEDGHFRQFSIGVTYFTQR